MSSMPKIDAPTVAEHHALRQAAIVEAAVEVLATEGAAALTPAAVAGAAGLARSSVYQYFASTGALVAAAVEETFRRSQVGVDLALATAGGPAERIAAYVDASLSAALAGHSPMAAYAGLDLPAECAARVRELHQALVAPLVDALAEQGVADARGVAELIGGVIAAAATQVQRGEDVTVVGARARAFVTAAIG